MLPDDISGSNIQNLNASDYKGSVQEKHLGQAANGNADSSRITKEGGDGKTKLARMRLDTAAYRLAQRAHALANMPQGTKFADGVFKKMLEEISFARANPATSQAERFALMSAWMDVNVRGNTAGQLRAKLDSPEAVQMAVGAAAWGPGYGIGGRVPNLPQSRIAPIKPAQLPSARHTLSRDEPYAGKDGISNGGIARPVKPADVALREMNNEAHALLGKGTRYKSTAIGRYADGSLGMRLVIKSCHEYRDSGPNNEVSEWLVVKGTAKQL